MLCHGGATSIDPTHTSYSPLQMDLIRYQPADSMGNCNCIVLVDHFSKLVSAYPAKDYDALTAATALFQHMCTFGLYDEIISDPGSDFMSQMVASLNAWFGIRHKVSLVDRHESNGVEGTNKQLLRHLRALVHDERLEGRWSHPTVLPLIVFTLNDCINSETGQRPFDMHFGSEAGTYFRLPTDIDPSTLSNEWLRIVNTDLAYIRQTSKKFQDELIRSRVSGGPTPSTQNRYQPGDFVLFQLDPTKPKPTKFTSPFLGPYEVLSQTKNDVQCRHLCMGNVAVFHVTRLKLFAGSREDSYKLSLTDADQHQFNRILAYIGDPAKRTTFEFEIEYSDGTTSWEVWSFDLFNTVQYETFCRSNPELYPLCFSLQKSTQEIRRIRHSDITTVTPGDTFYFPLRCYDPYWYDTLDIPDPYHIRYVVKLHYTKWTRSSSSRSISARCDLFNQDYDKLDNYFVFAYGSAKTLLPSMQEIDSVFIKKYPSILPSEILRRNMNKKP